MCNSRHDFKDNTTNMFYLNLIVPSYQKTNDYQQLDFAFGHHFQKSLVVQLSGNEAHM